MNVSLPENYVWPHKHLIGLEDLSADDIRFVMQTASGFASMSTRSVKKVPALRGKVVVNLFFESSTRTKSSFYLAASRLSADTLDFTSTGSSVSKGETVRDTAMNIEAMGVDIIVCRHMESGVPRMLSQAVDCSVVNAGDGQHEHPTQALLDIYTMGTELGRSDFDFSGLNVGIAGDIAHSRVARSLLIGLKKLGANVLLIGPPTIVPRTFEAMGCEVHHDFDAILERLDVANMLRVQFERITSQAFPSVREYSALYGLSPERLAIMKKNVLIMHPGPINRGLEVASEVADGPNSVILKQVTNGLAVRMAVLFLVHGAQYLDAN